MVDSKTKAMEIHLIMINKNASLPFTTRFKKSKTDSIQYAEERLSKVIKADDKIYWGMILKYLNKI